MRSNLFRRRRLGRPFGVELRPRAVVRIAVKIALRVARNALHLVGFDALCVICVLPEPIFDPAPLHDWTHIVVSLVRRVWLLALMICAERVDA
jgi:hypothetical protein